MKYSNSYGNMTCLGLSLLTLSLAGCQTYDPTVQSTADTSLTATQVVATGLSAAAGAMGGEQLNSKWGAPVGAVVGGLAADLAFSSGNKNQAQRVAEAYEQGKRDAAVEKHMRWWQQQQNTPADKADASITFKVRPLSYEGGTYHGVIYGPRILTEMDVNEPVR